MRILSVENLNVEIDEKKIIKDLSFDVDKGEIVAIIGPNGAGKTVLFRALLSSVFYTGKIKWAPNLKIGYVPQRLFVDKNFPLSVGDFFDFQNISHKKAIILLQRMGLGAGENKYPDIFKEGIGVLSGGELQRFLIAWILADDPDVLLFDESTAGIDMGGEENVYQILTKLQKIKGFTILLISHDINIVYKYSHKVVCLNRKRVCYGSPLEVLNAENLQKLYGEDMALHQHIHS